MNADSPYCETLPIHDPPVVCRFGRHTEALPGYAARLCAANQIRDPGDLLAVACQRPAKIRMLLEAALSESDLETFASLAGVHPWTLRRLTCWHLASRLGVQDDSHRMKSFAAQELAGTLRYCPACLRMSPHYRLLWGLTCLLGCAEHGCRLLERCPRCGMSIALLVPNVIAGFCPTCGMDLRRAVPPSLSKSELAGVECATEDLALLCMPSCGVAWPSGERLLGQALAAERMRRGYTLAELSALTHLPASLLKRLELPQSSRLPVRIVQYLAVAHQLDVNLRTLLLQN